MQSLDGLKEFLLSKDNSESIVNLSKVPQICREEPCMLGVDEAGRGPVLGPMVYGIAYCPLSKSDLLKDLGCADSKTLTEESRDVIFSKMLREDINLDNIGWATEVISPQTIANSMYRRAKHSLNEVSMESAIMLVKKAIEAGVNVTEVYVDTVGPPEKYQAKLQGIFPDLKITVAKKADSTYPIVSAASIAAKVTRDHALKVWKFKEGFEETYEQFGSGYPGDPLTKKFLRENIDRIFGYPILVRFSWSTAENLLQEKAAACTFENLDEDDPKFKKAAAGSKRISSFFSVKSEDETAVERKRHKFFEERLLSSTVTF